MAAPQPPLPQHPAHLWRNPEPQRSYDVVLVGSGGHGLATAYCPARDHGIRDSAVLERGWLAGGNMARSTTSTRSSYLLDESAALYDHALNPWERWPEELEYDFMFSQRGVLNLAHTEQEVRDSRRRVFANQLNGVDAERVDPDEIAELRPILDLSAEDHYPVPGRRCNVVPASPSTTTSPGRWRASATRWASTSSRTARSPGSAPTATG